MGRRRHTRSLGEEIRVVVWVTLMVLLTACIFAGFGGVRGARTWGICLGALTAAFGIWNETRGWRRTRRDRVRRRRRMHPAAAERLRRLGRVRRRARRAGHRPPPPQAARRTRTRREQIEAGPAFEMEPMGRELLILGVVVVLAMLVWMLANFPSYPQTP